MTQKNKNLWTLYVNFICTKGTFNVHFSIIHNVYICVQKLMHKYNTVQYICANFGVYTVLCILSKICEFLYKRLALYSTENRTVRLAYC